MTNLTYSARLLTAAVTLAVLVASSSVLAGERGAPAASSAKLDVVLRHRARELTGRTRVIVQFRDEPDVRAITSRGGSLGPALNLLRAHVADVANTRLAELANDSRVERVSIDRPAFATMERTGAATGARVTRDQFALTGAGVGVAIIDSGVTSWHDDLYLDAAGNYVQRVVYFKDFVSQVVGATDFASDYAFDDYGHGTHVAGIIAGNGYDSHGARSGIAPQANLIALKVLDARGRGYISNVIAALEHAIALKSAYNIRVINLSVGAGVFESYKTDPLAQAAKHAVDAGIVVVAAAGNFGKGAQGEGQYGAITSPGNAPWVLTVGAMNHGGTVGRRDDVVARFSSRGPTWIDFTAKPDIVAPGVGTESTIDPYSALYATNAAYLLSGTDPSVWYKPYLSLTGTSMAAPVVAGAIALMIEANPHLTPNAIKAILQYTAQLRSNVDFLTQGAGYLNVRGAVRMAKFFAKPLKGPGTMSDALNNETVAWSRHFIWGNYRIGGGVPLPGSNAWATGQPWGATKAVSGANIVWGVDCNGNCENIVWSAYANDNIVWSNEGTDNVAWSTSDDNIVWGVLTGDNIVWSTDDHDNIVWGLDCGGSNCANNIVWGMQGSPDGLWGTADAGDNIVWRTLTDDNIVWSTMFEHIISAMSAVPQVLWRAPGVKRTGTTRDITPARH
jgi:serine protease AprX